MICILECDYVVFAVRLAVEIRIQYILQILLLIVLLFGWRRRFEEFRWNIDEKSAIITLFRRILLTVFVVIVGNFVGLIVIPVFGITIRWILIIFGP